MKRSIITSLAFLVCGLSGYPQSVNKEKLDSFFTVITEKNKGMGSVAISRNGRVVYTRATGHAFISEGLKVPATVNTKYRIGSITKMFTAVIIFQLTEENKMNLDDKLAKYFPEIPNASKITIANMLNHHSGIHNFTDDSLFLTYNTKAKTKKEMLDIIAGSSPDFEPGSKAQYSNSNFVLLGYIAENITGKSYQELVEERITSKLNLSRTYVPAQTNSNNNESYSYTFINTWKQEPVTDMSIPGGAGALVSTPVDLVKFIESLFMGKLVNMSSLEKMKTIQDNFGMGMFKVPFYEKIAMGHNGGIDGFGSMVGYFPSDSIAVAYCSNGQVYPINDIMIGILSIIFNRSYSIPSFKTVELKSEELDKYLGVYSSTSIPLKLTVTKDKTTLMAQATGQASFPLEAVEPGLFKFDKAGVVIQFAPAKKELTLSQAGKDYLFTMDN
ncbi:MAG: serine hydrolase domain-containing protein [Ferruginibacter sp.]